MRDVERDRQVIIIFISSVRTLPPPATLLVRVNACAPGGEKKKRKKFALVYVQERHKTRLDV